MEGGTMITKFYKDSPTYVNVQYPDTDLNLELKKGKSEVLLD